MGLAFLFSRGIKLYLLNNGLVLKATAQWTFLMASRCTESALHQGPQNLRGWGTFGPFGLWDVGTGRHSEVAGDSQRSPGSGAWWSRPTVKGCRWPGCPVRRISQEIQRIQRSSLRPSGPLTHGPGSDNEHDGSPASSAFRSPAHVAAAEGGEHAATPLSFGSAWTVIQACPCCARPLLVKVPPHPTQSLVLEGYAPCVPLSGDGLQPQVRVLPRRHCTHRPLPSRVCLISMSLHPLGLSLHASHASNTELGAGVSFLNRLGWVKCRSTRVRVCMQDPPTGRRGGAGAVQVKRCGRESRQGLALIFIPAGGGGPLPPGPPPPSPLSSSAPENLGFGTIF